jgi:glycosyltransferase involved in cell wall biosynthesis
MGKGVKKMQHNPLVSVIIIFLNAGETFFKEAIASVFAQTYPHWELLLVDDGSTDISTKIARQYASQYSDRIRYLEHEFHQNRGMSASRNLGIEHARGNYIALLDADDIWLPQKLEKQVAILAAHPEAAMVYGSTLMWFSWQEQSEPSCDRQRNLGVEPDTVISPPTLVPLFLQQMAETPGTCSVLMRREIVQAVGGFENSFRGMFEDQAFFYKVCLRAPVFIESGCWDRYRQHTNNSCSISQLQGQYSPDQANPAHLNFLTWLEQYLKEQDIQDSAIWQALNTALQPYQQSSVKGNLKTMIKSVQAKLKATLKKPGLDPIEFGDLRRVIPVSRHFGFDRGLPIDRYYIEKFLAEQSQSIQGRVLEIGDNSYTREFGRDRVITSDVLHVHEGNPNATIIGDLTNAENIPSDAFDCFIFTQTLHLIYDLRAALTTLYRILKPGGTALITAPGISQIAVDEWKDYWLWSFTELSMHKLFSEFFPADHLAIETFGNVLAATAFLQGLATQELKVDELNYHDPSYQVLIAIRATKPKSEAIE